MGGRLAAVAESSSGVWRLEIEGLGLGDRGDIGVDLVILLRLVGHQVGGQDVAWTATLASASTGRVLGAASLLRSAAYPFEPESVR